jgi:hypothetical protein
MYGFHVKRLAYTLDRECWLSYSGKPVEVKRALDVRRQSTLDRAQAIIEERFKDRLESPPMIDRQAVRDTMLRVCQTFGTQVGRRILSEVTNDRRVTVSGLTDAEASEVYSTCKRLLEESMPPLKIAMMLHFYAKFDEFPGPERVSPAYSNFVRQLLAEGMVERPTTAQKISNPGWAYKATEKGRVYVEALKAVPMPVMSKPVWVMPSA